MSAIRAVIQEMIGLFVDDGSFALAIVAWLLVNTLVLPHLRLSGVWSGAILFAGLALILIESAARRAAAK
jgi:hypothetical protein